MLNGAAKKEEVLKQIPTDLTVTEYEEEGPLKKSSSKWVDPADKGTHDDSDCDAEILDDDDDPETVKRNLTKFQLKKLQEERRQEAISEAIQKKQRQGLEMGDEQMDSDVGSERNSKMKNALPLDIEKQTRDQLMSQILCSSCMERPKCMLIHTCKHVPFCQECDTNWKLQAQKEGKPYECPLCRKEYKKTSKINNFTNE